MQISMLDLKNNVVLRVPKSNRTDRLNLSPYEERGFVRRLRAVGLVVAQCLALKRNIAYTFNPKITEIYKKEARSQ